MKAINQQLIDYVERTGISRAALARQLDVKVENLYKWMKGATPSDPEDYKKLESFLGNEGSDERVELDVDIQNILSSIVEQTAANTARLNVLIPIVEELYAKHHNEKIPLVHNELQRLIEAEGERILERLINKYGLK